MQRRKFLKDSLLFGGLPIFLNSIPIKTMGMFDSPLTNANCTEINNRALVLIQMEGGNDGLNTIIPIEQYNIYKNNRPSIFIPDTGINKYITLDNSLPDAKKAGLHPAMTSFKDLYDAGKLNIINGVGYAHNNRSHFKASDIFLSAGDSTPALTDIGSGFMGRYLDFCYPGNINNPTVSMPDPLGLEMGSSSASLGFKTAAGQYPNILLTVDAGSFSTYVSGLGGAPSPVLPTSQMGQRLAYIRDVEESINAYSNRITSVHNAGTNLTTYPANSYLSYQLKTVARLIKGGSKTKIFLVNVSGYDTHSNQVISGNTVAGAHANLLKDLGDSIKAFQTDLQLLGIEDKVVTATFTEFGRTLPENASFGTDHGGVNNMFIIGKSVQPGVTGNMPDLTNIVDRAVMNMRYDYRSVYASLLQEFLGAGPFALAAAKLDSFENSKAPVFKEAAIAAPSCYFSVVLPIMLHDLKATLKNNGTVDINWQTKNESNTTEFEVQKSDGVNNYSLIGVVKAAGNSSLPKNYLFNDTSPFIGINQYRLKLINSDAKASIFGPVSIRTSVQSNTVFSITPNPAVSFFNIKITTTKNCGINIVLHDIQGHLLYNTKNHIKKGDNNFRIDITPFPPGLITVMIQLEDGTRHSQQILCS